MDVFQIIAALITLSALLAYANHHRSHGPDAGLHAAVGRIDFDQALPHGILWFLLSAGTLHVDLNGLASRKLLIGALATAGVVGSTLLVGGLAYLILQT